MSADFAPFRSVHWCRSIALWGPPVFYALAIWFVSSESQPPAMPQGITDKHAHLLAYGGFAVVLLRALTGGALRLTSFTGALSAAAMATAYGATDELHQLFVPGRSADVLDLLADATGAVLAAMAILAIGRTQRARMHTTLSR